jgi:hypothetical protein
MSYTSKFLPAHPKIVKKVNKSPQNNKTYKKSSTKSSMIANIKQVDQDS